MTICHATGSDIQPYEQITVSDEAVEEGQGHNNDGHQDGQDIIPPGPWDPDGRNWTPENQALYANGCEVGVAPPTTAPPATTPSGGPLPATR